MWRFSFGPTTVQFSTINKIFYVRSLFHVWHNSKRNKMLPFSGPLIRSSHLIFRLYISCKQQQVTTIWMTCNNEPWSRNPIRQFLPVRCAWHSNWELSGRGKRKYEITSGLIFAFHIERKEKRTPQVLLLDRKWFKLYVTDIPNSDIDVSLSELSSWSGISFQNEREVMMYSRRGM